ncbi:MAG: 30S ribosomal protein S15 [Candidatus Diapherotrites archaeon]|nr:30S ribosomal protein S15 [Candidatus Diapherotrites archaeon]
MRKRETTEAFEPTALDLEKNAEKELLEYAQEKAAKPKVKEKLPEGSLQEELADFKPEEVTDILVKLANAGTQKSEMGLILRDQYGIGSVKDITGKTITQILKEQNLEDAVPEDILNLIRKSVKLLDHMNINKKDFSAKHGFQLTVSKINRLAKYYKSKKILAKDWKYTEERARLMVK